MSKSTDERYEEARKARMEYYARGGEGQHATKERVQENIKAGMLPLSELIDGAYYLGWCRNAVVAQWQADKGCFVHWRTKFGSVFTEEINHPENDDGYDLFTPLKQIEPTLDELLEILR